MDAEERIARRAMALRYFLRDSRSTICTMAGRAARSPGVPSTSAAPRIAALIEALDPEVRDAIGDVDRTLIVLSLEQSPWDRLRSASRMARALARIRDAATSQRR